MQFEIHQVCQGFQFFDHIAGNNAKMLIDTTFPDSFEKLARGEGFVSEVGMGVACQIMFGGQTFHQSSYQLQGSVSFRNVQHVGNISFKRSGVAVSGATPVFVWMRSL